MSFVWTLDAVRDAVGDGPAGDAILAGVSTDSRTIAPGSLFVALRGDRFDAHEFLEQAVAQGAAALVVTDGARAAALGVPVYVVPDTLVALGALARYRRRAWGGRLVAVAGSNGKTSTKELLRAALAVRLRVHATTGNLNNRVGLPLTLLAIPDDADVVVAEVGTNVPGEVAILRDICEPDAAIVTSIGEEHLEGLHDLAGVLREEASVFRGVALAVTPAAQPEVAEAARPLARRVLSAGLDAGDVRPTRWAVAADGTGSLTLDGVDVHVPLRGVHNLRNAMLALATARELGVPLPDAARGIAAVPQPSMRTAWEPLGQAVVLNDAYNANPSSMYAAFDLVAAAAGARPRVAVLGEMLELGAETDHLHHEVARRALDGTFDLVAGVGRFADVLAAEADGTSARVVTAPDADALWPLLEPQLAPDAFILLKGSRGMRLERLVPHLTAWAAR
ncbi:MAG TPA: UDP-N-acetylmuramoyl-tripeptide--D-alanyl-D-alanine ligase [Gemmatimonadaceae bacterium]|nr:UDP-N-acetylmuramoyl-tripeptide--D-alanyl-D-alanine ligase [Gemmatimonadaceae bacterium]